MSELKEMLRAFLRGKADFEALSDTLDRTLAASPGRTSDIAKLLQAARDAGLPKEVHAALAGRLPGVADGKQAQADASAYLSTVVLPRSPVHGKPPAGESAAGDGASSEYLETVVLPGGSGAASRAKEAAASKRPPATADPDATVLARDDADATVLAGDDDRTVLAGPDDADATVFAGDDDRTVLASDDDRTVLAGPDDADATVFAGDDDRTVLNEHASDGDATAMDASRHDEATEINPDAGAAGRDDATVFAGPGADDDATAVSRAARDEDATAINTASANADATTANPIAHGGDATALNVSGVDGDRTAVTSRGARDDAGFDIIAPENLAAADRARESSGTGASWPTAAPEATGAGITRDYGTGDRIRERFQLISKLGEGGMGAVWKAKDLLKEEARDRNPFVAMKLLQGDFKAHPEAFIALQRETAKQQRLAHPNIATVYDFDRDGATGTVFMTMEVMEGQPLDSFIRKLPADGLPYEEAMPLIEQLSAGLQYAHDNGLVHSDLKPGNCFLTKDGTVKLLDFGIARASKTKTDAEGETTLFDPGQLGALTPTYATIEMFEGEDPDQRDDIYALAIIAYQLLTGRHPYGKKSAPKARELKLEPAAVPKLNKRQNRALRKGLAFLRNDRTANVNEFLEGLRPHKSRTGLYAGVALAALLVLAAGLYIPAKNWWQGREREAIIHVIQTNGYDGLKHGLAQVKALSDADQRKQVLEDPRTVNAVVALFAKGDKRSIDEGLDLIKGFDPAWQKSIMDDQRTRTAIVNYYEGLRDKAANPSEKHYDFPAAEAAVDKLKAIYPDSATVYRIATDLKNEKDTLLNDLSDKYNSLLQAGKLIPEPDGDDIEHVLALVRQIDPKNRLLHDNSLKFEFAKRTEAAMKAGDLHKASAYLKASLAYAPDDPSLSNLRYQVQTALKRQADEKLVAQIQKRLHAEYPSFKTLADFQRVHDDLLKLADLSPTNPVLTEIQNSLKKAFGAALDKRIAARQWQAGENLLVEYAKLLDIPFLTQEREQLSKAEAKAGFALAMNDERKAAVAAREKTLRALLAKPNFTGNWELKFKVPYKELLALLPIGNPSLEPIRNATAKLYIDKAEESRKAGRFAEATAFLDRGRTFYPGLHAFDVEQQAIAAAEEAERKQRAEQERLARLERRKGDLLAATRVDDVEKAKQILAELKKGLPANDPFVTKQGPDAIAQSYMHLAKQQADNKVFDNAVALAKAGLQFAPDMQPLKAALARYEAEAAKHAQQIAVGKIFNDTKPLPVAALRKQVAQVKAQFPGDWPQIARGYAASRADKLKTIKVASADDAIQLERRIEELKAVLPGPYKSQEKELASLLAERMGGVNLNGNAAVAGMAKALAGAKTLFPSQYGRIVDEAGKKIAGRIDALNAKGRVQQARDMYASARKLLPTSKALESITLPGPCPCLAEANKELAAGHLKSAYQQLQRMQKDARYKDDPSTAKFKAAYEARYDKAARAYQESLRARQARNITQAIAYARQAASLWTDSPQIKQLQKLLDAERPRRPGECSAALAGYGTHARAVCWDNIGHGERGPAMVVVPAGGGNAKPFAIGKYEVSVADWNRYCRLSHRCKPKTGIDSVLPVTGITIEQAEGYARWLSRTTHAVYQLPTDAEWLYAAKADGKQPPRNEFNCRVQSGDNIIKGLSLVNAQSGPANGWGLVNYVGNAQEWVKTGNKVSARGGAFSDPLTKCGIGFDRAQNGSADGETGFRLVREIKAG